MKRNSISEDATCPSYKCEEGSLLLGVRQNGGKVAILPKPLKIDKEFIDIVNERKEKPEQNFRFASQCKKNNCKQWTKNGCGVAIRISKFFQDQNIEPIVECSLRPDCRWFKQEGENV